MIFDTLGGFRGGFLSVLTSFPDISDAASDLIMETGGENYHIGVSYCVFGVICGVLAYLYGGKEQNYNSLVENGGKIVTQELRTRASYQQMGKSTVTPANSNSNRSLFISLRLYDLFVKAIFAFTIIVVFVKNQTPTNSNAIPTDLAYPHLKPPLSSPLLGLSLGCFFSALGAVVGEIIVRKASSGTVKSAQVSSNSNSNLSSTSHHNGVLARALNNALACALVFAARLLIFYDKSGAWDQSYILMKFMTCMCGALSAMSGTIADVCDSIKDGMQSESALDFNYRNRQNRQNYCSSNAASTTSFADAEFSINNATYRNYGQNGNSYGRTNTGGSMLKGKNQTVMSKIRGVTFGLSNLTGHIAMLVALMLLAVRLGTMEPIVLHVKPTRFSKETSKKALNFKVKFAREDYEET